MEGSKSKQYTSQKDLGGYWLGICESTFNKNNFSSKFLILITLNAYFFIFLKDPSSLLSREEQQKKAWKAQSQKNILAKKTMEAIGWEYVSLHYIMYILTFFKVTYNIFGLFAGFFSKGSKKPFEQRGATKKSLASSKQ